MSMSIDEAVGVLLAMWTQTRTNTAKSAVDLAIESLREKQEREKRAQTNGDRIRSMSNEEMADLFSDIYQAGQSNQCAYDCGIRNGTPMRWHIEWLDAESNPFVGGLFLVDRAEFEVNKLTDIVSEGEKI